jgi:V/A-type H+/Na+-transporting ATPase subunit I
VIVPMVRVQVASRATDRDTLLDVLARLAALHVVPADPARAVPDDRTATEAALVAQARQIVRGVKPAGARPSVDARAAADEIVALRRQASEHQAGLAVLHRQVAQQELWGEVRADRVAALENGGLTVLLLALPMDDVPQVEAEVVEVVARGSRREVMVLAAGAPDRIAIPPSARLIDPPAAGLSALRDEAAALERALEEGRSRLAELAHLQPELDVLKQRLDEQVHWSIARRGVLDAGRLCGLEGWMPADRAVELEAALQREGVPAAVRFSAPAPHEQPPTLVRYPPWAQPIRGVLDMLGATPGYSELDLSGFFMIALPIFAGMIIADAGYGLIFLLVPVLFPAWTAERLGVQRRQLLLLFGVTATVWGAMTGVWFGFFPPQMIEVGGVAGLLGALLHPLQLIRGTEAEMRAVVTKVCMLIGSTHLITGHILRALALAPSQRVLAEIGWGIVLAAMGGLIWILLFGAESDMPGWLPGAVMVGLATGGLLVVLFMAPDPNPLRRVGLGLAGTILPLIGTFGDTLSYIRLMAVGLAGTQIGAAFNTMSGSLMNQGVWAIVPALLLLVGGHLLNLGLVFIAIVAHGVRLNMLEFSSHAGVQWTGYPFRPLALNSAKET